jgi:hypothetical protein
MSSFVRSFIKPRKSALDEIQSVTYCSFVRIPEGPHKKLLILPYDSIWAQRLYDATAIPIKKATLPLLLTRTADPDEYILIKTDEMAILFSQHKDTLKARGYHFITCDTERVLELGDKIRLTGHYLREYLPKNYTINCPSFPCFLKKNDGMAGRNVRLYNNQQDYYKTIAQIPDLENYIVQEAITSDIEYSAQFLVLEGKIHTYIAYYQISTEPLFVRPRSVVIESMEIDLDLAILAVFEMFFIYFNGFINANFKIINKKPIIFEFNTRISGDIFYISDESISELVNAYCTNC